MSPTWVRVCWGREMRATWVEEADFPSIVAEFGGEIIDSPDGVLLVLEDEPAPLAPGFWITSSGVVLTGEVVESTSEITSAGPRGVPSLAEVAEREDPVEFAAARATVRAFGDLQRAVAASGLSQADLADAVGVEEEGIASILAGDGNLHLTTYARLMRACGYNLTTTPVYAGAY